VLERLRTGLIEDVMAIGYSRDDATDLIETHLVAWNQTQKARVTIAASPDAIQILGLFPRELDPDKPVGWSSVAELVKIYRGSYESILHKMQLIQYHLTNDVSYLLHCHLDIAHNLVETHLIGHKHSGSGRPGLAASPEVVRLAVADAILTPRHHSAGSARG
jgi:hypothetical protein